MKTKTVKVYSFSELSNNAQEKAINNYYENEEYFYLSEDLNEELNQIDSYFYDTKIYYSLNYCQGDGLCILGDFDFDKWIKDKYNFKQSVNDTVYNLVYSVKSKSNRRYCFASKSDIIVETDPYLDKYPNLEDLINSIINDIREYYMDICKKLELYGYSILDYRMDPIEFSDYADANNILYLPSGEQWFL